MSLDLRTAEKTRNHTIGRKTRLRAAIEGYSFIMPALAGLTLFLFIPMVNMIYYSFTDYYMLSPKDKQFIGFDNFIRLFADPLFYKAFNNTLYFVVLAVPLQTAAALGMALLLNRNIRFKRFFTTAFFSPVVMSLVIVGLLFTFLYNPNNGLFNAFLNMFGFESLKFLYDPDQAMNSIIFMSIWQGAGYQMLIFLAGLKEIPIQLYEAASIDGATAYQKFRYVTLPGLRNVMIFVLITITMAAFRLIIQPMVMTQGGPLNSTKTLLYFMYEAGFQFRDLGYGSAIAVVFLFIVLAVTFIQRIFMKEDKN